MAAPAPPSPAESALMDRLAERYGLGDLDTFAAPFVAAGLDPRSALRELERWVQAELVVPRDAPLDWNATIHGIRHVLGHRLVTIADDLSRENFPCKLSASQMHRNEDIQRRVE